jgi:hypothetical protein
MSEDECPVKRVVYLEGGLAGRGGREKDELRLDYKNVCYLFCPVPAFLG